MKRHPFTLVEILAAIVVVSILTGMGLGIASYASERGKEMRTQSTLKLIEAALEQYKRKFGDYPVLLTATVGANIGNPIFVLPLCDVSGSNDRDFNKNLLGCFSGAVFDSATSGRTHVLSISGVTQIARLADGSKTAGNLLDLIVDGWGNPIIYLYPGVFNRGKYDLGSLGPDGFFGEKSSTNNTKPYTSNEINEDGFFGEKISGTPTLGTRSGGNYKTLFGNGDDIVNFKR